jgi:UDP-N-acetylmuramoylalanine--D-glutamate ligase
MGRRALVYGLAIAGEAVARALVARGWEVAVADDAPSPAAPEQAAELGAELHVAPTPAELTALVGGVDLVVPSPGVPEHHPVLAQAAAAHVPVRSEIDLAYEWEQQRAGGPRPMVAITGTDGKTTTTLLATAMVEASGRRAVAAGNTEVPLVSALDLDVDVFIVECTSFRLAWAESFRPAAGTWLNLAEDHLDWHASMDTYAAAKARIWEHQTAADAAIGCAGDAEVLRWLARAPARHVTFAATGADYHVAGGHLGGHLVGPAGPLVAVGDLRRRLPHDLTNTLAAAATVLEGGVATREGVAAAAAAFAGVPHRIALVAHAGGVSFYDDSKATTPHAVLAAIRAFDHVVLVAGGRNKGLDLRAMAAEPSRVRAVVAIGDAAPEVAAAFTAHCPVSLAGSMDEAVATARTWARDGDVVLLSPGCASFDWYAGYAERGDDFARAVREQVMAE